MKTRGVLLLPALLLSTPLWAIDTIPLPESVQPSASARQRPVDVSPKIGTWPTPERPTRTVPSTAGQSSQPPQPQFPQARTNTR